MVRTMTTKRTVVQPFGSTVGKSRRKIVPDAIELSDLGCHALKSAPVASISVRFAIARK